MRRKGKRLTAAAMTAVLTLTLFGGCGNETQATGDNSNTGSAGNTETAGTADAWGLAETSTYEPYPETVTYTIGVTARPDVAYPEGSTDTVEDSAYTRFLKAKLNIQNEDLFEAADGDDYRTKVSMAITSGEIPDIMSVNYDEFKELVENDMVEDLTEAYNNCASDLMKDIYASNDNRSLEMATVDGKLYAIPTTAISSGPEMLWLRGDWMDELGLSEPETLEDIETIVKAFIEKDPGGNGAGKTIGIPLVTDGDNFLYGSYSSAYRANNIFTLFGAYPEQWVADENGNAVYGSVQPEMKEGLKLLADWYKEGIIDQQMAIRSYDEIKALVTDGKCGSYFCGWWAPYDLAGSYELNPDVEWRAYILPAGDDGKVTMWTGSPNQDSYFVVRKGFEHPELLVKAKSLTLDYNQGDAADADKSEEAAEYVDWVAHGYGVEFIGGFDWFDAAERAYLHINEAMENGGEAEGMNAYEHSLYESCEKYVESVEKGEKPDKTSWIDYNARIVAGKLMNETEVNVEVPVYFSQTESMGMMWDSLKTLERTTMLKIITNEIPVDEFDNFVEDWMQSGGEQVTREVNEEIGK